MDPTEIDKLMTDDAAAEAPPEPGVELSFPMAALSAAGENPDEEMKPEAGDAVAIQLEGTFVREEGGMGIVRVSQANGEAMTAPKPADESETMMDEGEALRAAAGKEEEY